MKKKKVTTQKMAAVCVCVCVYIYRGGMFFLCATQIRSYHKHNTIRQRPCRVFGNTLK